MRTNSGFSMVEMLVVVGIFTMMMAGLYTALAAGNVSWQASENGVAIQRDARNALWVMAKDLRKGSGAAITQSVGSTTLIFTHPTDGSVTYTWSDSGANAKKLIRQMTASSRILANNISALTFTDQTTSILISTTVTRSPTVGPSASLTLSQEVAYR
ncbi:MAG: prepilin-type N-terminal cleavage/methylation domain-containing protein [Candidatus Omnitrophota bacterium]|nr:prepilin-type N-terminal cleavage/methylation domain-containing protein [Candidatus Omnitrophota bacterium]